MVQADLCDGDLAVPLAWLCMGCRARPGALDAFAADQRAGLAGWPDALVIREQPGAGA
ncbi:MAG TPA: hypothetical protein VFL91_27090 [Thermomicrobiales bacterium]|nr:hypothetical protein [Thermomicrobiales bacterium]